MLSKFIKQYYYLFNVLIVIASYLIVSKIIWYFFSISGVYYSFGELRRFLNLVYDPKILLIYSLMMIVIFIFREKKWDSIDENNNIKIIVTGITFLLFWKLFLMDYNYYFNKWFILERVLLLLTFALTLYRPIFLILFIAISLTLFGVVKHPDQVFSVTDIRVTFDVLVLFVSYVIVKPFIHEKSNSIFWLIIISMHASNYFIPGLYKILGGENVFSWIFDNNLLNLAMSSYSVGWLGFITTSHIQQIYEALLPFKIPLAGFAIFTQIGALFLFINKRIAKLQFYLFEMLHLGIFVFSGIFFWKWIYVNLLLIIVINRFSNELESELFSKKFFYISLIIITLSNYTFKPFKLAWFDTGINWAYIFEYVDENGNKGELRPEFWAPYDVTFAQMRFNFLEDDKVMLGTFGTINVTRESAFNLFNKTKSLSSFEDITQLSDTFGYSVYDSQKSKRFVNFVQKFIESHNNERSKRDVFFPYLRLPFHIYRFPRYGEKYPNFIKSITLRSYLFLNNNGKLDTLKNREIYRWDF